MAMPVELGSGPMAELPRNKKGSKRRMKKTMLLGVLMLSAAAGYAQESRQDVSFSGTGLFGPTIHGANTVVTNSTGALGLLMSYRYMVTPRSALLTSRTPPISSLPLTTKRCQRFPSSSPMACSMVIRHPRNSICSKP